MLHRKDTYAYDYLRSMWKLNDDGSLNVMQLENGLQTIYVMNVMNLQPGMKAVYGITILNPGKSCTASIQSEAMV